MNIADAIHLSHEAYERQMRLFTEKSHDYASNADTLSNSKRVALAAAALGVAKLLDTGSADAAYLLMALWKLQRWCNLRLQDEPPRCETMRDTTDDAMNYLRLAALAMAEEATCKESLQVREEASDEQG